LAQFRADEIVHCAGVIGKRLDTEFFRFSGIADSEST